MHASTDPTFPSRHSYVQLYVDSYSSAPWVLWPNTPAAGIPFPPSTDLVGYYYAAGANAVTPGIGADTWYPSWATDGHLYSSWTDGVVDGVHSGSGKPRCTWPTAAVPPLRPLRNVWQAGTLRSPLLALGLLSAPL